jgi:indolepyruvate ferredoxin oxidoreductase beta subunit
MKAMNIYLCGMGGQGIGLLSEVLIRACMEVGYDVMGVDTHGLAQRGGTVASHLRIGRTVRTPLIAPGQADLVIGLERLEALRGALTMLRPGGTLIFYDTMYQPIAVRLGRAEYPAASELESAVRDLGGHLERVYLGDLPDARMQNVALLGSLAALGLIDDLDASAIEGVLESIVPKSARQANLDVFRRAREMAA